MDSNIWLQLADWMSTRSPLPRPKRSRRAAAIASTRASISRQVHCRSRQTKPMSSGLRRAAWVRKWERFITRVEQGTTPPGGVVVIVPIS